MVLPCASFLNVRRLDHTRSCTTITRNPFTLLQAPRKGPKWQRQNGLSSRCRRHTSAGLDARCGSHSAHLDPYLSGSAYLLLPSEMAPFAILFCSPLFGHV